MKKRVGKFVIIALGIWTDQSARGPHSDYQSTRIQDVTDLSIWEIPLCRPEVT